MGLEGFMGAFRHGLEGFGLKEVEVTGDDKHVGRRSEVEVR